MAMRALEVVGYGYLVSLIYAILDFRFALATILRADILHCIGLSLLVCTYFLVGRSAIRGQVLTLCVLGLCGLCQRFVPAATAPCVRARASCRRRPITRFPLLPLWFCGDWFLGRSLSLRPTEWSVPAPAVGGSGRRARLSTFDADALDFGCARWSAVASPSGGGVELP